jgi:predicted transposase/invertase (TIGR01784 family)
MKNKDSNINLLTDFGFKRFFGTERYKSNLIHFLNAFLPPYIGMVDDITYLPTEQLGQNDQNKRLVFDVLCANPKNDHIIIEMQKASQEFLKNRIIAYSSRHISNSLEIGDRKYSFPTILTIVLVDFEVPELRASDRFLQHVMLKDDNNDIFSDKMSFLLIDLTKFAIRKSFAQLADDRQKWCYVIKNIWQMEEDDIPLEETVFRELCENCKVSKLNAMEKQEYEKSVLEYDDVKDAMEYHHRLGKEEGRAEERKIAENEKREIIARMLEKGIPIDTIAEIVGITEEDVTLFQTGNKG